MPTEQACLLFLAKSTPASETATTVSHRPLEHAASRGNLALMTAQRPTPSELAAAAGRRVPDLIAPGLDVLFCGINPGLWSAAVGHHFARPGNRFWKVLHGAGFSPEVLAPEDELQLLDLGLGITNLVPRSTAAAAELDRAELRLGARRLVRTVSRWRPGFVAFLGMGAFRIAYERPRAGIGEQPEPIGGARIWLLPNPSGLQAHYQFDDLVAAFAELRGAVCADGNAEA
jgi:TDG/mug DNA glycosylase family protein